MLDFTALTEGIKSFLSFISTEALLKELQRRGVTTEAPEALEAPEAPEAPEALEAPEAPEAPKREFVLETISNYGWLCFQTQAYLEEWVAENCDMAEVFGKDAIKEYCKDEDFDIDDIFDYDDILQWIKMTVPLEDLIEFK